MTTHHMRLKLIGGGVDFKIPNVSYCKDVKDVHFNPYNLIKFYVGNITGTTPQTVKIYTDSSTSIPIQVSEGNKWYTYVLPKDKGLYKIESGIYDNEHGSWSNGIVTKAVIKTNISYSYDENNDTYNGIVPWEITEASFKGSDTSNITDMNSMFQNCNDLTSLDLSGWNTSNVTHMDYMFCYCFRLTSLDLSGWDTSNVTKMNSMFNDCTSLSSLDLSGWNVSNVTDMGSMFSNCSDLTSLDLSGWDTSKVTSMNGMFNSCNSLTSLTLSNFDTSNVTNMSDMFRSCGKLKTITMIGCGQTTIDKIKAQLTKDNITGFTIVTK